MVIETPVFPGYTPGVAPRTIYEDEQARTKYRTRAKQTAAKAQHGPSQVVPSAQGKHPLDSTSDGKKGPPGTAAQPLSKQHKKFLNKKKRKRAAQGIQDHDDL